MPEVQGQEVTLENVKSVLADCAANQGDDYSPPSHSWGYSAGSVFLNEVRGTPLYVAAQAAFAQFMRDGSVQQAQFAASLSDPALIPGDAWFAGLARADLDEDTKRSLRFGLGMAVGRGGVPYEERMRAVVGRPGWSSFMSAYALHDHDWFIAHLHEMLPAGRKAAEELIFAIRDMNRAEAIEFQKELVDGAGELDEQARDVLVKELERKLVADEFTKGTKVRW